MQVKKFNRCMFVVAMVIVLTACSSVRTESEVRNMTLEDTQWRLVQLLDEAVSERGNPMRHPALAFLPEGRVAGSDGCNRLMGGYRHQGKQLQFTQLASTMMACVDGMETADQFNLLMAKVHRYNIEGDVLELFSESGELLMRFYSEKNNR